MKRINVYEAEPGDWRWEDSADYMWYHVPVTNEQYAELVELEASRNRYNALLKRLKDTEVERED